MKTEIELFENALDTTSVNGKKLRKYINENYISNSVLDQIRAKIEQAKIEQEYEYITASRDETLELGKCLGLKMALKIVDKYKAESEDK